MHKRSGAAPFDYRSKRKIGEGRYEGERSWVKMLSLLCSETQMLLDTHITTYLTTEKGGFQSLVNIISYEKGLKYTVSIELKTSNMLILLLNGVKEPVKCIKVNVESQLNRVFSVDNLFKRIVYDTL